MTTAPWTRPPLTRTVDLGESQDRGATGIPAITRIARTAFAPSVERIGRPPAPTVADHADPATAGRTWVAVENAVVVGCVVLLDAGDHSEIDTVAVDPGSQGLGVGHALLQLAEDDTRRRGRHRIELYTNEAMTEHLSYDARRGDMETHRAVQDGFRRVLFVKSL